MPKSSNSASTKRTRRSSTKPSLSVTDEQRNIMIAEAAYYIAEQRGFEGDPLEHWLQAELQVNNLVKH